MSDNRLKWVAVNTFEATHPKLRIKDIMHEDSDEEDTNAEIYIDDSDGNWYKIVYVSYGCLDNSISLRIEREAK